MNFSLYLNEFLILCRYSLKSVKRQISSPISAVSLLMIILTFSPSKMVYFIVLNLFFFPLGFLPSSKLRKPFIQILLVNILDRKIIMT